MAGFEILNPTAPGAFATYPYGDAQEVTGPPQFAPIPERYREFLFTDARSILLRLIPHHRNFFPNPAFRVNTLGWVGEGAATPAEFTEQVVLGTDAENVTTLTDLSYLEDGRKVMFIAPYSGDQPSLFSYPEQRITLVRDSAATLEIADSPVGVASAVPGWRVANLDDALIDYDSWVGQSLYINGDLTLRYRDLDSNGDAQFVYVGPETIVEGDEWWMSGRPSPEWTFTAFFKGEAEVRMVMEAYRPINSDEVKSPPENQNLPLVSNPEGAAYNPDAPTIVDPDGFIWNLNDQPFYERVLQMAVEADPAALTRQDDPFVMDPTNNVWQAISPQPLVPPLYQQMPDQPSEVPFSPNPETLTPADVDDRYLVTSAETDPGTKNILYRHTGITNYVSSQQKAAAGYIYGQWTTISNDDWERLYIQTGLRTSDVERANFQNCHWVDARVEVRFAKNLRISALQLDPTEYPIAPYFDGDMTEEPEVDDFVWSGDANNSVSEYYRQRRARTEWAWRSMGYMAPVARPVQMYYLDYSRPYIPPGALYGTPNARRSRGFSV